MTELTEKGRISRAKRRRRKEKKERMDKAVRLWKAVARIHGTRKKARAPGGLTIALKDKEPPDSVKWVDDRRL